MKSETETSAYKLARAMESYGLPEDMIKHAKLGYYGDFTSPLDCPITQLLLDLGDKYPELSKRVIAGEFDG